MEATLNFIENPEVHSLPVVTMTEGGQRHIERMLTDNEMAGFGLRFAIVKTASTQAKVRKLSCLP